MPLTSEVWDRLRDILASEANLNEANTKGRLIEPVLDDLGWDIFGEDIEREWQIDIGTGKNHADYVLKSNNRPVVLIEAKSLGTELDARSAKQGLSYASVEKVKWCLLTNGRSYRIFNAEWSTKPDDALFCSFEIDPKKQQPKELDYLSRESVVKGKLDELSSRSKFSLRLKARLSESIDELQEEVLKRVSNVVYGKMKGDMDSVTRQGVMEAIRPLLRMEIAENSKSELEGEKAIPRMSMESIDDHFQGKYSAMRPVYNELVQAVREALGDFTIYAKKYYIAFKSDRIFTTVEVRGKWLLLGLAIESNLSDPRVTQAPKGGWTWVTHYVSIEKSEDIDERMVNWLRESFRSAISNRLIGK